MIQVRMHGLDAVVCRTEPGSAAPGKIGVGLIDASCVAISLQHGDGAVLTALLPIDTGLQTLAGWLGELVEQAAVLADAAVAETLQ